MKKLILIFHGLYFAYLFISILLFAFKQGIYQQVDLELLTRFLNFWVVLGFIFFISIWVIQAIYTTFLKKDIEELELELYEVKSKLYDVSRTSFDKDTRDKIEHESEEGEDPYKRSPKSN